MCDVSLTRGVPFSVLWGRGFASVVCSTCSVKSYCMMFGVTRVCYRGVLVRVTMTSDHVTRIMAERATQHQQQQHDEDEDEDECECEAATDHSGAECSYH